MTCSKCCAGTNHSSCSSCLKGRVCNLVWQFLFLYIVTFLVVLPLACNRLRNSVYYKRIFSGSSVEERNELINSNNERLRASERFLATFNPEVLHDLDGSHFYRNRSKIELVIVTQSRNRLGKQLQNFEPFYLTQVVSEWLRLLGRARQEGFPFRISTSICNVDGDPATYQEATNMARYMPMINRFPNTTNSIVSDATNYQRKRKEKEDFVFCHNQLLQKKPDYLLVVEDDSVPHRDFFKVLHYVLEYHIESPYRRGSLRAGEDVDWVKLYHPHYYSNFLAPEAERVPEWLSLSFVLGSTLTLISRLLLPAKLQFNGNIYIVWLSFVAFSLLLTLAIARPNLMELRRFLPPYFYAYYPAPGCCTPGMLYSYKAAVELTNYLDNTLGRHTWYARDQVMSLFVEESPRAIKRYMVQPNLLTHIGLISSVRGSLDATRVEGKR